MMIGEIKYSDELNSKRTKKVMSLKTYQYNLLSYTEKK